ncbi:MAG: hypothetical protein VB080_13955 [Propionicimonas sp.]|uniref:hypothetical protein n=1 Tax=Propionicimonas sp. TaxID=1955623 RepID=UPI002B210000|nr:hypothetical protein [Propionicimonas sp.]MEA4945526.1 hypothetical protein [Propionicimonas sp.]MEA5054556.1 hypothetical protein [Propionicimonas sp.]MEA5118743.1 hypothetical protein [Propionicimonas sp.]
MPRKTAESRPPTGIVVASIGAGVVGVLLAGFAVASVVQGHGTFSGAIGIALGLYGVAIVGAAWGLWRGSLLARGPVIATGVLNLITAVSMAASAPLAWLIAAISAVTVGFAALPSTSAALSLRRAVNSSDGPPPTDEPRS